MVKKILIMLIITIFLVSGCSSVTKYKPENDIAYTVLYPCYANGTDKTDYPIYASSDTTFPSIIFTAAAVNTENHGLALYRMEYIDGEHYGSYIIYDNGYVEGTQDLFYTYCFQLSSSQLQTLISRIEA